MARVLQKCWTEKLSINCTKKKEEKNSYSVKFWQNPACVCTLIENLISLLMCEK